MNIDERSTPYVQGQEDARMLFNHGRTPDWILIEQLDTNRASGMRAEWAELTGFGSITPGSHRVDIRTGRALGLQPSMPATPPDETSSQ